jgi:Zn-dependent peptidase ImmA (M78 family)
MDANLTHLITAAKQQAAQVLDENFVSEPPVLVEGIAKNYGLQVKVADLGSSGNDVAGFIDPATKIIYVNKDDSPARQAFTVAHELGHWFLHHEQLQAEPDKYAILYRRPLGSSDVDAVEKQANFFAANLLVPKEMLEQYRDGTRHNEIAKIFGVSPEVIGYRFAHEFDGSDRSDGDAKT